MQQAKGLFYNEESKELLVKYHGPGKVKPCHATQHVQREAGQAGPYCYS